MKMTAEERKAYNDGFEDGRMRAGVILRTEAERAHATTAEILLRLAREIEQGD